MASSSKLSARPSAAATPAPSSPPPPSESYFSELDGTAPSVLGSTADFGWDASKADWTGLNLVSWRRGVDDGDKEEEGVVDDVGKRGFYEHFKDRLSPVAISTVLNHPSRKANPLRSTRKPLPPLAPPMALAKPPPPSHYDTYLKSVTPLYETFLAQSSSSASATQPLTGAFDVRPPDSSSLPPLDGIPEPFFDSSFDLSNPATWAAVTGSSSTAGPSKSAQVLQDDLSTHLDTLERHLIHEITLRSTSFFSALSNLQDLHSESASCLGRIQELQTGLKEVGENTAKRGLQVIDKQDELYSLRMTERGLDEMKQLEDLLEVTKGVIDGGDWSAGLSCLENVQRWWERHSPDSLSRTESTADVHLPLATLPALEPLPQLFKDVTTQLALLLESALHAYLLNTLSSAELDTPYDKERFRNHVAPIVEGLVRCGAADGVEGVWRDVVTLGIREGSRKHLPVSPTEDEHEDANPAQEMRGANLAQALKSMDHGQYLRLSIDMYTTMLSRLRLVDTLNQALHEVTSSSTISASTRLRLTLPSAIGITITDTDNPDTAAKISAMDTNDILAGACDLANVRASKILGVRGEQHAGLKMEEFVQVFKESWGFILATEQLGGRAIPSLRGITAGQARTFLIAYHSQRLTRSAKLVEEEQWAQIDITPEMQHGVDVIIHAATDDPDECFVPPRAPRTNGLNGDASDFANGTLSAGLSKTLDVESSKFFVVRATAESIELLSEYLKVVVNLELVTTDVMGRIIEFLKSFNSRTCQVVLGAGAMRSAGLKNITAKHLALASQSLSAIVALIPYIREFIRRHLSAKQAVMLTEFDRLKRDYQEHQNEIHAKLVAIMSDRLAVHCGSLRDVDWEATPDKAGPRAYAELLVKETATLHKVLSKYLAASTVESVMSEVLAAIVHRLSEEYGRIELKSEEGKQRMSQDVQLIATRLQSLSEAGQSVASLETLVKDKPVPRKNIIGGMFKRGKRENGTGTQGAAESAGGDVGENDAGEEEEEEDGEGVGVLSPEDVAAAAASDREQASTERQAGSIEEKGVETTVETGSLPDQPPQATQGPVQVAVDSPRTEKPAEPPLPPPPPPTKEGERTIFDRPATADLPTLPPSPPAKPTSPPAPPPISLDETITNTSQPSAYVDSDVTPIATPQPLRLADSQSAATLHAQVASPSSISPSLPHPNANPFPIPATTAASIGLPPSVTSSPVSISSLRSPPPAPHPGVQGVQSTLQDHSGYTPSTPTRAPRISLANRLKGVVTRSGNVDAGVGTGTGSPSGSPVSSIREVRRGSGEGRMSGEGSRGGRASLEERGSVEMLRKGLDGVVGGGGGGSSSAEGLGEKMGGEVPAIDTGSAPDLGTGGDVLSEGAIPDVRRGGDDGSLEVKDVGKDGAGDMQDVEGVESADLNPHGGGQSGSAAADPSVNALRESNDSAEAEARSDPPSRPADVSVESQPTVTRTDEAVDSSTTANVEGKGGEDRVDDTEAIEPEFEGGKPGIAVNVPEKIGE